MCARVSSSIPVPVSLTTRVEREVEQRVLQQRRVAEGVDRLAGLSHADVDALVDAPAQQLLDLVEEPAAVDGVAALRPRAREREELAHELRRAARGALDDVEVPARGRRSNRRSIGRSIGRREELPLEQGGAAQDPGELIVEVVRHAARELPDDAQLLPLHERLLDGAPLADVARHGQDVRAIADGGLLHRDLEREARAVGALEADLEAPRLGGRRGADVLDQRAAALVPLAQQRLELRADELLATAERLTLTITRSRGLATRIASCVASKIWA